jgi:hypothetical protein
MEQRNLSKIVVAAAVAAVVATVVPGVASSTPREARRLAFDVRFSPLHLLDLGAKGLSKGDEIISHDFLLRRGRRVGHDGLACTITDPRTPEATCQVTFQLPGGTIAGQFLNSPPPKKLGAITGGTGAFRRAQGQFELIESGQDQTGTVIFRLSLPA